MLNHKLILKTKLHLQTLRNFEIFTFKYVEVTLSLMNVYKRT